MSAAKGKLTAKQARFVEQYLVDLNATQAAIRAGYSIKTAAVIGFENLRKPAIAAAVAERQTKESSKTGLRRERILREVEIMAHSCITDYVIDDAGKVELSEGAPADAMRAIKSIKRKRREWSDGKGDGHTVEVEVELTFWDKPGMVRLAGKHKGIEGFSERIEAPTNPEADVRVYTGLPPDDDDLPKGAAQA